MKNNIRNTAILVMIFSVLTRTISFVFKIYLSREFGAQIIGLFSMATAVFGLLTMISSSGIPLTVSRQVAETNKLDPHKAQGIVSSGLILSLLINSVIAVLFVVFRKPILSLLSDSRAEKLCLIVLPATFSTCIYNVIRAYFMGRKNYAIYSVTELVEEILNVGIVLLLVSGLVFTVEKSQILAITFTVADILCFILIVVIYFCKKNKLARPNSFGSLLKSSTPITLMRLFSSLAVTFTAIVLPNRLVASGETIEFATAEFGRATGMAYPLLFAPLAITSALSVVLLPEIAELNVQKNYLAIANKLDKSINISFAISSLFFIVYFSIGEELCLFLFNDARAGVFLSFASGMVLLLSLCQLTTTSLNSIGKEKVCFVINIIGLALLIACLYFLPKYIGILALAVGHTVLYFTTFLLNSIVLNKLKITDFSYYKTLFVISVCSLTIAVGIKYLKTLFKSLNNTWIVIISGVVICIVYAILILSIKSFRVYIFDMIKNCRIKLFNKNKTKQKRLK